MRFADRREAGAKLGRALAAEQPVDPVVTALPRGGVPVGYEVALALGCELDVLVVRKVGVPFHPELAMGAVAEGEAVVMNRGVMASVGIDDEMFEDRAAMERAELEQRLSLYRKAAPAIDPRGRTTIVVDDGLATGSTALVAIAVLRARGAAGVWLAVPVAPADSIPVIEKQADRVIVLEQPRRFMAVGAWYRDFSPTTDSEVLDLLRRSRH
ncbi:MAG TPA: phosphoribosyltransferase [Acidimicrobiia bacterium]|nr:phosphoribosyltransferase [Acidimicrobiia bacterium]